MVKLVCSLVLLFSLTACANTGSTVGNGLIVKEVSVVEENNWKKFTDVCEKKYHGKVITKEKSKVCLTSDKKELTLSDLEKDLK